MTIGEKKIEMREDKAKNKKPADGGNASGKRCRSAGKGEMMS